MKAKAAAAVKSFVSVKVELQGVYDDVKNLVQVIESVNTYQLTKMVELVREIEQCSPETRQTLMAVMGYAVNNGRVKS